MELHSIERGCYVLTILPIPQTFQAKEVISLVGLPQNCGLRKATCIALRQGARGESVMVQEKSCH